MHLKKKRTFFTPTVRLRGKVAEEAANLCEIYVLFLMPKAEDWRMQYTKTI